MKKLAVLAVCIGVLIEHCGAVCAAAQGAPAGAADLARLEPNTRTLIHSEDDSGGKEFSRLILSLIHI